MLKEDSRKVVTGDTFIALKTINNDGHNYVNAAISAGANKVIVEKGLYSVETLVVEDTFKYLLSYLKDNYSYLIDEMNIIGVTGTNGKTTTCYLIYQSLNKLGKKCAYIGTLGFFMAEKINDLSNTTPSLIEIYEMLLTCYNEGYRNIVMEVSSHGLDFDRVLGIKFNYAVFTNLTKDHLDHHITMDNYALSKQKLFNYLKEKGKAIINIDDSYYNYFLNDKNNNITYSFNKGDYFINFFEQTNKSIFEISGKIFDTYESKLLGKYNIYNLLVTVIVLNEMSFEKEKIKEAITELEPPKGRMDIINYKNNKIIIDYAHTPDAVFNILTAVKEMTNDSIYTVVGCGGNRDKTKRPLMGEIATNLSTKVIFTSDNPRFEDPMEILEDITKDLKNKNYKIIENRENAIKKAIQMLKKDDILLLLGKGHETYQIIKDKKIFFDDKQVVLDVIGDD